MIQYILFLEYQQIKYVARVVSVVNILSNCQSSTFKFQVDRPNDECLQIMYEGNFS